MTTAYFDGVYLFGIVIVPRALSIHINNHMCNMYLAGSILSDD